MQRQIITSCGIAIAVCALLIVTSAQAQRRDDAANPTQQQQQQSERSQAGQLDDVTQGANVRASQLIGMAIENPQEESLGSVEDLVVNANSGKINYVAVTYGGFLDVGNAMYAVPFEAFEVRQDPDDADTFVLVLDVTQEQMEGAEGFDERNWPDFGNQQFRDELDRRYGVDRSRQASTEDRDTTVDVSIEEEGAPNRPNQPNNPNNPRDN